MGKLKYTVFKSFVLASLAAGLVFSFSSCNPMPNNGVPIYLHVDSASVVSVFPFGSDSNFIPDVWATTGAHNLGAFEMPINIPILANGNVPMAISAGVWDNGIVNAPVLYPFYRPDTFTIANAIPGHVYHHRPVYSYFSNTQVGLNADFDANGNLFTNVSRWTNLQDHNVFEGGGSGAIIIPAADSFTRGQQTIPVKINTNGRQSYVEINYKITNPDILLEVGVTATLYSGGSVAFQQDYSTVYLAGNGQWRKAYLNFNNVVGSMPDYYFQVYMTAYHNGGQADTVFVDNVKLLYFN